MDDLGVPLFLETPTCSSVVLVLVILTSHTELGLL